MAQLINVKLSRFDAQPWGFRLQGGKDFGTPLLIQKVTGGSLAEKAGLQAGDAVIKVNTTDLFNLRHKDAQDAIVRAGNNFEITVQRGGSTWKPAVTPVGALPSINSAAQPASIPPVTKTSLAARPQATGPLASGYNVAAKPFSGPQVNGSLGDGTVKSIVNKQYNTPVGIYSEETIAETLSAQAEVLAGGVLGVNFKKNEKSYNPGNSEVLKLLQEIDNEPRESEPDTALSPAPTSVTSPPVTGLRHVSAPETRSTPTTPHEDPFKILPPGQNICADCERLIVGVFVRIKDKNLHVECFKCATCGSSLKNVGYYNINNKLYCDIHAKLVARQHPPAPNLEPITIPPGGKAPAGAISAALAGAPGLRQGPAAAPAPRPVPAPAPAPAPALAPSSVQAPAAPGSPQTLGPVPFHPSEQQHKKGENGFVIENNLKNIISAMAPICINETDVKSKLPPASLLTKEYKAPRVGTSHVNAPRSLQTPSGAAPPKPFSAPTAPTTSPARPAPEAIVKTLRESVEQEKYPICVACSKTIRRGPFITALGKIWCPEHFVCVNGQCRRPLQDIGFVEEKGELYCEYCFEQFIAPSCDKCSKKIKEDCVKAIGKHFHPECFLCAYCGKLFGNTPFFLEDGLPYCETDWNELFTTKCFACGFPIEAGDRWVEALNNNYHSQCFNCTNCKKNLEGQSFYAKGGRPFCKAHAR